MQQLRIHVERIVRPVRAMEYRKLQMRRELLAHLELAVEEELARGQKEATAIQAAVRRLGEPAELTKQLQYTVPWVQRVLLAKMSVSPGFERWGYETTQKMYGVGPITLMQLSILSALSGLLSAVPCYMNPVVRYSLNHAGISPAHPALFFLALLIIWQAIYIFSCRLIMGAADPLVRVGRSYLMRKSVAVLALQCVMTIATTEAALDRFPSSMEMLGILVATMLLMAVAILAARGVARLRGRYVEWLMLEIA